MSPFRKLITLIAGLVIASTCSAVARPDWDNGLIDADDWLEQHSYDPELDAIIGIGVWNRRELEGHWPETEYSYWEWDADSYNEEDAEPDFNSVLP